METPAEFAKRLESECVDGIRYEEQFCPDDAVPLIEARDAAMAAMVIDSIENRIREQFVRQRSGHEWRQILPILMREQRAKFTKKDPG